jgi:hypothetical protein
MDKKSDNLKSFLTTFCESENITLSKELKLLWLGELMQEDAEAVKQACVNIMTGKHKVYGKITLKNILEQIRGNTEQDAQLKKEQLEKQADDAYIEFRRCVRSMSPYSNFIHEDKALIACVEDLGGWHIITNKTTAELDNVYMNRYFLERYKQNAQADSASLPEQAIGYAEQQNSKRISRGAVKIGSLKVV